MTTLGKYILQEQLGSGGFGTVYRAIDNIGRIVAIKVLKPGFSENPDVVNRFQREARAAGSLFHPHIATILDFEEVDGRVFLVMRFIDGKPLDTMIKEQGKIPWEDAKKIFAQIADALEFAHDKGFIHRDIKPGNIIVSPSEGAVLTDFGLVKAVTASGLSTTGVMLGTPAYIAPEIWEGKEATTATDVYSLACVFFEMLTGKAIFGGESTPEVMKKHFDPIQFPVKWAEDLPLGIEKIMKKAFAKDPAQRFSSAREMYDEINKLCKKKIITDPPKKESISFILKLFLWIEKGKTNLPIAVKKLGNREKYLYWVGIPFLVTAITLLIILLSFPKVVVTNLYYSTNISGNRNLYILYQNQSTQQVTFSSGNSESWDPCDTLLGNIYFTSNRIGGKAEIFSMNSAGVVKRITKSPSKYESWDPAQYLQGFIYFTSNRIGGKAEIYSMDGKGIVKKVTSTPSNNESWDPIPANNGNLYFTSNRVNDKAEIFVMDAKGTIKQVTSTLGSYESWGPATAVDGNLFFTSNRSGGQTDIYMLDKKGLVIRITHSPAGTSSWNPIPGINGSLYFTSNRDKKIKLYRLDASGKSKEVAYTPGNIEGKTSSHSPKDN